MSSTDALIDVFLFFHSLPTALFMYMENSKGVVFSFPISWTAKFILAHPTLVTMLSRLMVG